MIGDYVRWQGNLAKILDERFGIATIKVIHTQKQYDVFFLSLTPIQIHVV